LNSNWRTEITAVFMKELQSEFRSRNGLLTSGLFGVVAVVTIAFATFTVKLVPDVQAGLYWVAILFASVLALPRTFLIEEDQGTGDLLRLWARPHAIFWGKALFNLALIVCVGLILGVLFVILTDSKVKDPGLFAAAIFGGCSSLAGAVTLCGALVARASNRFALAAAVSTPMLLSILAFGVSTLRSSLGTGFENGWPLAAGSICYAIVLFAIGPWLFAAVWKS
jgi:heme exporter protein B